jgi:2-polyprenyl-3-methyl-5-hydroxy-6-metoxy-1,4-benzoquinol methylase
MEGRCTLNGELTTLGHWDEVHACPPRNRLPSSLGVSLRNAARILRPEISPGTRVFEIGFAPGKLLAWISKRLEAEVAGVDFSSRGFAAAKGLFAALSLSGDLRNESVFETSFADASFDVVYSLGVIEHFRDPRPIVRRHVELARPGGVVIIAVPNYRGIYGRIQSVLDAPNLELHNLDIMTPQTLEALVPADIGGERRVWRAGCVDPWCLSLSRKLPRRSARLLAYLLNGVGILQWRDIEALCPLLVLRIRRRSA